LRDRFLERIRGRMVAEGWTGDNLAEYVQSEMGNVLLDEPGLSAEVLAGLLKDRKKLLPASAVPYPPDRPA
jgi:hypothetical protein